MKQRVYEIEVDDQVIVAENASGVQFRVQFDITIDALGYVTYCDLSLSNIKEETANAVFKRGAVFAVRCGYNDNIDYIFKGVIRNVFKEREGATTNTRIIARGGTGDKKIINVSLGKNISLHEILSAIADSMGYKLSINKSEFEQKQTSGYVMNGDPFYYLHRLSSAYKFFWSLDADKLVVFKQRNGRNIPKRIINMKSGLEGIPEVTEAGVDFAVRMDPAIKIGQRIELDTTYRTFNFANVYYPTPAQDIAGSGEYTVMKITHSGDNYGGAWTTKCKCYRSDYVEVD